MFTDLHVSYGLCNESRCTLILTAHSAHLIRVLSSPQNCHTKSHLLVTNDPDPQSAYHPSFINHFYKLTQTRSWANCRHV